MLLQILEFMESSDTGVHGIIRAVLIYVPDDLKRAYIDIFDTITRDHLQ